MSRLPPRFPALAAVASTAGALAAVAVTTGALLVAGCGTAPARSPAATSGLAVRPALATAAVTAAGSGLAIIEMGGPAAQDNNYWQLFTRAGAAAPWRLATPKGVADNGGLVVAQRGQGSLVTGFLPSQDLTFSPLATSSDDGTSWSQGLVSGGLAGLPGALAAAPDGRLLAILGSGAVQLSAPGGTSWQRLTTERALASTPAGRACGLLRLTGGAFGIAAQPLLAGQCSRPGVAGIFAFRDGTWQAAGPALPAGLAGRRAEVAALAGTSSGEVALLATGTGSGKTLVAAWAGGKAGSWRLSSPFRLGASELRSASLGGDGEIGITQIASTGATLAGPGSSWRTLAALPARTATLVPGPGAQIGRAHV